MVVKLARCPSFLGTDGNPLWILVDDDAGHKRQTGMTQRLDLVASDVNTSPGFPTDRDLPVRHDAIPRWDHRLCNGWLRARRSDTYQQRGSARERCACEHARICVCNGEPGNGYRTADSCDRVCRKRRLGRHGQYDRRDARGCPLGVWRDRDVRA